MADLFYYSIKSSLCLATVYLFYRLVLRNLTFYTSNRWFLLIGSGLSFLIPLANLLPLPSMGETNNLPSFTALIAWNKVSNSLFEAANKADSFDQWIASLIVLLFWVGFTIQSGKLLIQFIAFFRVFRSATLVENGAIKIYHIDNKIAPFSFGKHIFLNSKLLEPEEVQQVIRHEWVHASQKHTLDVLWMECLLLVNWYNPFAWLVKRAVRENLEFIVDREVLINYETDRKSYQYLLLKIIGLANVQIANPFNISSLKNRIRMMNRKPSSRHAVGKYLLILPLLLFLIFTFCRREIEKVYSPATIQKDRSEIPLSESFVERNSQVKKLYVQEGGVFVVELKSGKEETYNFNNKIEASMFEQRYGQLPPPPPPVVVKPLGNNVFVVELISGEKEKYDFNNENEAALFKQRYGQLPSFPQPRVEPK